MAKFFGCSFFIALILAWPTFGISLVVWTIAFFMSAHAERIGYEAGKQVKPFSSGNANPINSGSKSMLVFLDELQNIDNDDKADLYRMLEIEHIGTDYITDEVASQYFTRMISISRNNRNEIMDTAISFLPNLTKRDPSEIGDAIMTYLMLNCLEFSAFEDPRFFDQLNLVSVAKRKSQLLSNLNNQDKNYHGKSEPSLYTSIDIEGFSEIVSETSDMLKNSSDSEKSSGFYELRLPVSGEISHADALNEMDTISSYMDHYSYEIAKRMLLIPNFLSSESDPAKRRLYVRLMVFMSISIRNELDVEGELDDLFYVSVPHAIIEKNTMVSFFSDS